jgi:chromosome partitioning protein
MPLIITFAHQKGGVGKSTYAANIKSFFALGGYKTALVDIDPQGSLTKLIRAFADQAGREPEHVIERRSYKNDTELMERLADFDVAVVDTPPYLSHELVTFLPYTDIVVVPCKPSPADVLAIGETLDLIRAEKKKRPALAVGVFLTMTIAGTDFTDQIRSSLENSIEFPVLKSSIGNRVTYPRSLLYPNYVFGDPSRSSQVARAEIESLGNELISLIKANHDT